MDFTCIRFVLRRRVATETDAVAEIVAKASRHHRVQIDNCDPLARFIVQHHVVQLRIVVRNA